MSQPSSHRSVLDVIDGSITNPPNVVPAPPTNPLKRERSIAKDIARHEARQSSATQVETDAEREEGPSAPEMDELYVAMKTDVVGIQHYSGLVAPKEKVMLQRDPFNPYDSNAVKAVNARNIQVGHIPRAVAAKLAPLMDNQSITVEGEMKTGNIDNATRFKLSIIISIYGAASARPTLEPRLVWATPGQRGFDYMRRLEAQGLLEETINPTPHGKRKVPAPIDLGIAGSSKGGTGSAAGGQDPAMQAMLDSLKKLKEDEKQANDVMDTLTSSFNVAKIPLHPAPPSIANGQLNVDLLRHQSQALQWMIEHENPKLPRSFEDPAVQFWKKSKGTYGRSDYWLNAATMTPQVDDPQLGKGGIIADGMGLGKTLSIIALVLATAKQNTAGYSTATLIICPLSVLSNWSKQIEDHVAPGHISFHVYHGEGRKMTAAALAKKDVVITTYQTVAGESTIAADNDKGKKTKVAGGPLEKVKWKRIVCDEGHVLRNPRAKMSQAVCALQADKRWVCTGTPIVNSPADLGSLLQFLQVCKPLDQNVYFKSLLLRKLSAGDPSAAKLLQALIGSILLRRTKESTDSSGNKLVHLPPLEFFQVSVTLDETTRKLYDDVKAESARRFQESLQSGEGANNVLSMLTRMRQLCLTASLIPPDYLEELRVPPKATVAQAVDALTPEERAKLVAKLRLIVAELEECPVCFDVISNPRITTCAHAFCLECITEVLRRSSQCPLDRRQLPPGSLIELPPDEEVGDSADREEDPKPAASIQSAKITELVKLLHMFAPTDKSLVFSQFTKFLDHVGTALDAAGISYCRFDGSMPATVRRETISRFQTPLMGSARGTRKNPQVMLISLKSGAVGLNLTAASNVFLMDPWWQTSIESQAIDRAHRMGQQKPVKVFQLIAEDTVESKVLEIQSRKDALITQAFAKSTEESAQAKRAARYDDFKEIFGITNRDNGTSSSRR